MLRHFEQALRPPQPLQAIKGPPNREALPWGLRNVDEDARYAAVSPAAAYNRNAGPFDQNEVRGLISRRLDNMSMRIGRVDTLESIQEPEGHERIPETTQPLLDRLRDMRDQIGDAVGVMSRSTTQGGNIAIEPGNALRQELEAWNQLEERIEREILHPGRLLVQNPGTSTRSRPIPIASRRPSGSMSPGSSPYEGWQGPPSSQSSNGESLSLSQTRTLSSSSVSPPQSFRLDYYLPVHM